MVRLVWIVVVVLNCFETNASKGLGREDNYRSQLLMLLYRLFLTPEEQQTLEGWQKKYRSQSPKLQRLQILLNSDEHTGRRTAADLQAILGVSTKTIERVRRQFCEEELAMFEPKVRKTRSDKKLDGRVEAHLTALLCQSPPAEHPRWQLRLLGRSPRRVAGGRAYLADDGGARAQKTNSSLFRDQPSG